MQSLHIYIHEVANLSICLILLKTSKAVNHLTTVQFYYRIYNKHNPDQPFTRAPPATKSRNSITKVKSTHSKICVMFITCNENWCVKGSHRSSKQIKIFLLKFKHLFFFKTCKISHIYLVRFCS